MGLNKAYNNGKCLKIFGFNFFANILYIRVSNSITAALEFQNTVFTGYHLVSNELLLADQLQQMDIPPFL